MIKNDLTSEVALKKIYDAKNVMIVAVSDRLVFFDILDENLYGINKTDFFKGLENNQTLIDKTWFSAKFKYVVRDESFIANQQSNYKEIYFDGKEKA